MHSNARKARSGTRGKASRSARHVTAQQELPSPVRADHWTTAILVSILVGTPLALLPARFDTYDTTPKLTILYLGSALLLWFAGRWWSGAAGLWRNPVGRAFYSLLILGVASLFISSAFSNDVWLSFAGTVWRRLGAVNQTITFFTAAALAGYVYLNRTAPKPLMLGMEAAGAITSVYAILQYAGWDPLIPAHMYTLGSTQAAVRPPATLSQATYFATFLLPAILIALGFRLRESAVLRNSRKTVVVSSAPPGDAASSFTVWRPASAPFALPWKRVHEVILFLSITALVLSGTRSALLGLGAGICALMHVERHRITNWRTLARVAWRALAFAAIAALFLLLPIGKGVRIRLAQWATDRAGGPRLLVWRDSLPILWQHPISGIGSELFEEEFRRAESLELARAYPDHYHESPHNFFLEVAIGQGVIGFAVWAGLLGLALGCGVIRYRAGDSDSPPIFAALIAMIISLQFCPLTITNELYLLTLSATLIGIGARRVAPEPRRAVLSPVLTGALRAVSVTLLFIASAYTAQTTLYAWVETGASLGDLAEAEHWYAAARKFPMPGPNLSVSRRIASGAVRLPPSVRSEAFATAKQAAEAAELGSAERFDAFYQSAMLAVITRDLPRAETKLRAAIGSAPTWYRPRMALACVLWWQGRNQEAQREAALALKFAGRLAPNVQRTLDGARAQVNAIAPRRSP